MIPYRVFQSIEPRGCYGISLADTYTKTELREKCVVSKEIATTTGITREYYTFNNWRDVYDHIHSLDIGDRRFHEVIQDVPQKPKFDIETTISVTSPECIERHTQNFGKLLCNIMQNITKLFVDLYRDNFEASHMRYWQCENFIICESSGPLLDDITRVTYPHKFKYSAHIIVPGVAFANATEATNFTRMLMQMLTDSERDILDDGVNKRMQGFRILGNHKFGENHRIKRLLNRDDYTFEEWLSTIVQDVSGCATLPVRVLPREDSIDMSYMSNVPTSFIESAINWVKEHRPEFDFGDIKGNQICFLRKRKSYCELCRRKHARDNTLFIEIRLVDNMYKAYFGCFKAPRDLMFTIFEVAASGVTGKQIGRLEKLLKYIEKNPTKEKLLPFGYSTVYSEPEMREYDFGTSDTLIVRANMKMGKSKQLVAMIDRMQPERICIVTHRITFANEMHKKFPHFTLYSDVKGNIEDDKVIIQVESLHRLHPQKFDLLVLDECESIFEQLSSEHIHDVMAKQRFVWLFMYSTKCICMDAHVGTRTIDLVEKIRNSVLNKVEDCDDIIEDFIRRGNIVRTPDVIKILREVLKRNQMPIPLIEPTSRTTTYHYNNYPNGKGDKYYLTTCMPLWVDQIYQCVLAGERVVIISNSKKKAKTIMRYLQRREYEKPPVIRLYSSETKDEKKAKHFKNVDEYWSKYDVLIYTPTVTAGCSFEKAHFDRAFAFFTNVSTTVETSRQMMHRVRNISSRSYHVCLSYTWSNFPENIADICNHVSSTQMRTLLGSFNMHYIGAEILEDGSYRYKHNDPNFWIHVYNVQSRILSRNRFAELFIRSVQATGASVELEKYELDKILHHEKITEIGQELMSVTSDIAFDESEEIAKAPEIFRVVSEREMRNMPRAQVTKAELRNIYNYPADPDDPSKNPITSGWVDRYIDHRTIEGYRNKCLLYGKNQDDVLMKMALREKKIYRESASSIEHLREKTQYVKFVQACEIVRTVGFIDIFDSRDYNIEHTIISKDDAPNRIALLKDLLEKHAREYSMINDEFIRHRLHSDTDTLRAANAILAKVFRIRIARSRDGKLSLIQLDDFVSKNCPRLRPIEVL